MLNNQISGEWFNARLAAAESLAAIA